MKTQVLKLTWGLVMGCLLMANESCDQAQTRRTLKKRVDLGRIQAPVFHVPGREKLDMSFTMNSLFTTFPGNKSLVVRNTGVQTESLTSETEQRLSLQMQNAGYIEKQDAPRVPACMEDLPMAVLGGVAISFDFSGSFGGTFGYRTDELGGKFEDLGAGLSVTASVKVDSFKLESIYTATEYSGDGIAKEMVGSDQSKTTVNGIVDFSGFTADVYKVFNTPIGTTATKSVDKGFELLTTKLDSLEKNGKLPWTAYVSKVFVQAGVTRVMIKAGKETGLCVGDELTIENMSYVWSGQACQSRLEGAISNNPDGPAVVVVDNVGERISLARLKGEQSDIPIQIGGRVRVKKLADLDDQCNPIQKRASTKKK